MSFEWKDEYAVGVEKIDSQHKRLFTLINQLRESSGATVATTTKTVLIELVNYTSSHFGMEEQLMKDQSYPESVAHLSEHKKLLDSVDVYLGKLEAGNEINALDLGGFLFNWLVDHIAITDKRFGVFLNKQGVR